MRQRVAASCEIQALDHQAEGSAHLRNGPAAVCEQREVFLPATATLRRWVADSRLYEALGFEAIEGDIDGADREIPAGTSLDFPANGRHRGIGAHPNEGEQDYLFKLADGEPRADLGDMFHIMKHIRRRGAGEGWPAFAKHLATAGQAPRLRQAVAPLLATARSATIAPMVPIRLVVTTFVLVLGVGLAAVPLAQGTGDRQKLLTPADPTFTVPAPAVSLVRLETTKGLVVIEVIRAWAPLGADRFVNLVRHGYYNDARIFRVRPKTWVQFGIAGDPKVAQAWRPMTFPDDPAVGQSNVRGTIAFAFAVPNGRTTQVFINLRDNSATHDKEPFVPFGRVIEGMEVADAFFAEYGEGLGGIRGGKQDAGFAEGNVFFDRAFPKLDRINRANFLIK